LTPTDLKAAADAAVECLAIESGDTVLVVFNDDQAAVAEALADAARPLAREVTMRDLGRLSRHGEEPPVEIAAAMAAATVVLAPTAWSLTNTQARLEATRRGVRIATLPTITEKTFARAVNVDYGELKRTGDAIAARLTSASLARILSGDAEITLSLESRAGLNDAGDLRTSGSMGNLPAGEAFIAPVETAADGSIIFDGSFAGYGRLRSPTRVVVEGGRAIAADEDAGRWLLETLDAGGPDGRLIAELGIGTNPAARVTGNVLEDEKVMGTAHVAFGGNVGLGGMTTANVHIDGILLAPTVELDGEPVLANGRLLVDD
jgi:leucyl aminopeptidase (aminopeptidase T)